MNPENPQLKTDMPAYLASLWQALSEIGLSKPNDRSEKDRMFAIAKTDLEKLISYCEYWLNQ